MENVKDLFIQNFIMERVALDLMELIDEDTLNNYMFEEFNNNFTYGELYDLFKEYVDKDTLEVILEDMGHDFVDLDELEEKEKYY